jgi:hypothetical protein
MQRLWPRVIAWATISITVTQAAAMDLELTVAAGKYDRVNTPVAVSLLLPDEVVEKTSNQTYFVRPDGAGKPNETRNWPDFKEHVNLPWNAMSFVLGNRRYTAAYLDKPTNPKEARYSERAYGRFGSYFVYDLEPPKTLDLNYRIWLQDGEMTVPEVAAKSADFVEPIEVTVK